MTISKIALTSSLLLTLSATAFANDAPEVVDAENAVIECVTAADVEAMTEEDKAQLALPVCEETGEAPAQ